MSDVTQLSDAFLYQASLKSEAPIKLSTSKRVVHIHDKNQGSYTSSVIEFDVPSQLTGSKGFGSLKDAYISLPYVVTMKNTGANDLGAAANPFVLGLKCGVHNIIDSLEVELNDTKVLTFTEYTNFWNNLRLQTEVSQDYVAKHGADSFLYPDDWHSTTWSATSGGTLSGDGYMNNYTNNSSGPGISATSTATGTAMLNMNEGFVKRLLCNPPAVGASVNSYGWPTLNAKSNTIAAQHGKGGFVAGAATAGEVAGTWYYMLKIRLVDLHPLFNELDLMANPQLKLALRVNQGTTVVTTDGNALAASRKMKLSSTTMVCGKTCPIMLASATSAESMNTIIGSNDTEISIGFGPLQNPLAPTIVSDCLPFRTARLYVPFYDIANPSSIINKPVKEIRYLDIYTQYFKGSAGTGVDTSQINADFDFQLSGQKRNVKYVAVLPFANTSSGNYASATAEQFQSPFDTAPWTTQPGASVRAFNVQIGNENVFASSHDYDYQQFMDEFSKVGAINGDQMRELSNGLIDLQKWSTVNRVFIADCSRISNPDVSQSVMVRGTNTSCQGTNYLVIVACEKSLAINRLTGEVEAFR